MSNGQLIVGRIPQHYGRLASTRTKVAVVDDTHRITWEQLAERQLLAAGAMQSLGLSQGDNVGTFLTNRAEYVELIYGAAAAGVVITPFSFRFVGRELTYGTVSSGAAALFVDADLLDVVDAALETLGVPADRIVVIGDSPRSHRYASYEPLLESAGPPRALPVVDENDMFWQPFTGGTTGLPKVCKVPHRVAWEVWLSMVPEFGIMRQDIELIAGAFYHGLGFVFAMQQLMVGGTVVIMREFNARRLVEVIEREGVSVLPMAPTMYAMLLENGLSRRDVSSLRVLISAGSALLTDIKERVVATFPSAGLFEYYGATEAGFYSILRPEDQLRKMRSCGLPFLNTELRVLDEEGNDVAAGVVGEIYKRGTIQGSEYLDNAEATAAMYRGEWHTSGDLGYLDEEGYLYLVDRKKDLIITGGANVFPSEVEDVILLHPDVLEVAVIGLPNHRWGETVKAYVVVREGSALTAADIVDLCRRSLASYKKPRDVEFMTQLPKSPVGKVLKRELRARERQCALSHHD